jgi:hypothetical protein
MITEEQHEYHNSLETIEKNLAFGRWKLIAEPHPQPEEIEQIGSYIVYIAYCQKGYRRGDGMREAGLSSLDCVKWTGEVEMHDYEECDKEVPRHVIEAAQELEDMLDSQQKEAA